MDPTPLSILRNRCLSGAHEAQLSISTYSHEGKNDEQCRMEEADGGGRRTNRRGSGLTLHHPPARSSSPLDPVAGSCGREK